MSPASRDIIRRSANAVRVRLAILRVPVLQIRVLGGRLHLVLQNRIHILVLGQVDRQQRIQVHLAEPRLRSGSITGLPLPLFVLRIKDWMIWLPVASGHFCMASARYDDNTAAAVDVPPLPAILYTFEED